MMLQLYKDIKDGYGTKRVPREIVKPPEFAHCSALYFFPASRTRKLAVDGCPPPRIIAVAASPTVFLNSAPTLGLCPLSAKIFASS